jgi:hypothetical protein
MRRLLYLGLGFASVALGALGVLLPLLPTVPFMLLAAFAISAALGLVLLPFPWLLAPLAAALVGGSWIATRPEA